MVSFTHVQNIIYSQTQLDGIGHEQPIICRQLFAGHVAGSQPMKREKNLLRMIINNIMQVLTPNCLHRPPLFFMCIIISK